MVRRHRAKRIEALKSTIEQSSELHSVVDLAREFGVSERTLRYDLSAIRSSGFPLKTVVGRAGGTGFQSIRFDRNGNSEFKSSPSESRFTVGYETERQTLSRVMEQANRGQPSIVAISGEAGSGKTHLVSEFAREAGSGGFRVVTGNSRRDSPAYWPWTQALRQLISLDLVAHIRERYSDISDRISSSVPELIELGSGEVRSTETDPAVAQVLLLDGFVRLLSLASEIRPIVIVLEDVHWADRSSLNLIEYCATRLHSSSVIVAVTVRTPDPPTQQVVSGLVTSLARSQISERIELSGLSLADTTRLIESVANRHFSEDQIKSIRDLTSGNPLFVIEYARLLRISGTDSNEQPPANVPAVVQNVISQRLASLSNDCLELLKPAAVLGETFEIGQLERMLNRMLNRDSSNLTDEAIEANIITAESPFGGLFQFSHALTRSVILEQMTRFERAKFHLMAADVLQSSGSSAATDIASHLLGAGPDVNVDQISNACLAAGTSALQAFSFDDATVWYKRALEHHGEQSDLFTARAFEGLARCGIASNQGSAVQETDPITSWAVRAFELLLENGDTTAALRFAVEATPKNRISATNILDRAAEFVTHGTAEQALLDSRRSMRVDEGENGSELSTEISDSAVRTAEVLGYPRITARVFSGRANLELVRDNWSAAIHFGQIAITSAREIGDDIGLVGACFITAVAWVALGRLDNAARDARTAVDAVKSTNIPFMFWQAYGGLSGPAMMSGEQVTIKESADWFAVEMPDYPPFLAKKSWQAYETGDTQTGSRLLAELAGLCRDADSPKSLHLAWTLAKLMRLSGDLTYIDLVGSKNPPDIVFTGSRVGLKFAWLTGSAIIAVLKNDVASATIFYDLLLPHRGTAEPGFWGLPCTIDRLLGQLAAVISDRKVAASHFEDSLVFCRDGGFRPELAHACNDYSLLLMEKPEFSEPSKIAGLISEGSQIAADLSLNLIQDRLDESRKQLQLLESTNSFRPAGLTSRELEVLQLLTMGHSNRELAVLLSISEHTVFSHVSRILSKTGSESRAQAIAYAHGAGLS